MKSRILLIFIIFWNCNLSYSQCQFGERYSNSDLNIKKQKNVGDTASVHIFTNGSLSYYILKDIDHWGNYYYDRDCGYLSKVKIKYDSLDRAAVCYYKYNAGYWSSAGHGTSFYQYFENGNIKTCGYIGKHFGGISFFDTLNHEECDLGKVDIIRSCNMLKHRFKWYVVINKSEDDLYQMGFINRKIFYEKNKDKLKRVRFDWKNGFVIDQDVIDAIFSLPKTRPRYHR